MTDRIARPCQVEQCPDAAWSRGWCNKHYKRWRKFGDPMIALRATGVPVKDRLARNSDRSGGPDACWPWLRALNRKGYGSIDIGGREVPVHRAVYETYVGPIPEGLVIDHLCHTSTNCRGGDTCPHRSCTNPRHLAPTTSKENSLRGCGHIADFARRTHCKHGHEFSPENILHWPSKFGRKCRACEDVRYQAREERKRAQRASARLR